MNDVLEEQPDVRSVLIRAMSKCLPPFGKKTLQFNRDLLKYSHLSLTESKAQKVVPEEP